VYGHDAAERTVRSAFCCGDVLGDLDGHSVDKVEVRAEAVVWEAENVPQLTAAEAVQRALEIREDAHRKHVARQHCCCLFDEGVIDCEARRVFGRHKDGVSANGGVAFKRRRSLQLVVLLFLVYVTAHVDAAVDQGDERWGPQAESRKAAAFLPLRIMPEAHGLFKHDEGREFAPQFKAFDVGGADLSSFIDRIKVDRVGVHGRHLQEVTD